MNKKVLVIGSGGREHALAWKLAQSAQVSQVYCAPGNDGMADAAVSVDIDFTDAKGLVGFAQANQIDLTVIGQEAASEAGVVDAFEQAGLTVFGPTKKAALIESSKTYSKDIMADKHIPTAAYKNFSDAQTAIDYANSRPLPVVIKADGLATGKGVTVAQSYDEAEATIRQIMVEKVFGESGNKVVVEDFLSGQEVSTHALCDGKTAVMFPASQDHKQIFDGDMGPNTGGMGVIAPVPWVSSDQLDKVHKEIVQPVLEGLRESSSSFRGCLYPGLMIEHDKINVVEFNCRFGDPEAEVYMRLLDCDFYQLLYNCATGRLRAEDIAWKDEYAVSVVLASAGYPESSSKGDAITGLESASKLQDIIIFHAATKKQAEGLVTDGGRVLNVTATGETLEKALDKAYAAVKLINFKGMQYRTDIGQRSI